MNLTDSTNLTSSIRWWLLSKTFNPKETDRLFTIFSEEILQSASKVLTLWIEIAIEDLFTEVRWDEIGLENVLILYSESNSYSDPIRFQMILDHMWEYLDKLQPSEGSKLSGLWHVMCRNKSSDSIRYVLNAFPPNSLDEMYWSCKHAYMALLRDSSIRSRIWNSLSCIFWATPHNSYDPLPFFEKLIKADE